MKRITFISTIAASLLFVGCGSSSSDTTETAVQTGYLVDSAVANADYDCLADGVNDKQTGPNGEFQCQDMSQIRFRIGNLVLGEISALPQDGYVFPQDLVGVSRDNTTNAQVVKIAQLLQSLDTDADPSNGISIDTAVKNELPSDTITEVPTAEAILQPILERYRLQAKTQQEAMQHLQKTVHTHMSNTNTDMTQNQVPSISTTPSATDATDALLETIRYMNNEERLAYDLYMNLYNHHNQSVQQLYNIAQNSETRHIQSVEELADKYGLEPASNLPSGQYDVAEIQNLYDTLYTKGINSVQDALEVGCMVEVTDINDLNQDIQIAQNAGAQDVVQVFEFLRNGSYNHYWAFDKGLKNMGISEGCCSLGSEWCHPEYPNTQGGNGQGGQENNGNVNGGNGQGHKNGKN